MTKNDAPITQNTTAPTKIKFNLNTGCLKPRNFHVQILDIFEVVLVGVATFKRPPLRVGQSNLTRLVKNGGLGLQDQDPYPGKEGPLGAVSQG